MKIVLIKPEHHPIVDSYLSELTNVINPILNKAITKAQFASGMQLRHKATDVFWMRITLLYPEIDGMACGLVSENVEDKKVHYIAVQGLLKNIKEDLASGKAMSLNIPGSDIWKQLMMAKLKGLI